MEERNLMKQKEFIRNWLRENRKSEELEVHITNKKDSKENKKKKENDRRKEEAEEKKQKNEERKEENPVHKKIITESDR